VQRDGLGDRRPEPGGQRRRAHRLVGAVQPIALGQMAAIVDQVAVVVKQGGGDQAVGRVLARRQAGALQRVVELRHPLAVALVPRWR